MTSSMLAGERRWASSRRGGMTVLGKVAVPKPINLPSQKLENHGLDPNVEIVPKGSLSWGSRSSPSTSNPWGSSALSPNADGTAVSPHHPGGRPSSGGGLSRPSTAGSERHEPSATTWGPNSRPSSASGLLASNQSPLTSSRPLSSETRPGSSHLSRFAEPAYENSGAWGPNGTSDKLSISSKVNDFSLSSGDFPTLGSEKDNTSKSSEPHDHASYIRPGSSSGRNAPGKERNELGQAEHKSGTVDTWTRDGSPNFEDGVHPNADRWHGDPHQYFNSNVPPQHYDAWRGPPMNAPPGVWYRGPPPPPAGPPYPPVPHGGYPMEPFPYYRPQIPPPLPNSQSGPPPGPGPRGHHPRNGDFYRPQMDAFIRPGMPIRPGFYPGPVPYDGYFGPPMGYNPNDRDMPFMGMPPGPPVYNMCQPPNPPELNDPHFRGGARGPGGNFYVSEKSDSVPPEESRGPYKVLRKRESEKDAEIEDNWDQSIEKVDQIRPSLSKTDTRRNEGLIQNIEVSNEKTRASDAQMDAEQSTELLTNTTIAFGSISITGDLSHHHDKSRQVRNQVDHHNRDNDRWQKKPPFSGSEISAPTENPELVDPADGQAQRAKMREIAKQRAIERQREEEERIREQKAKARAKLEELNRRTLAPAEGTTQTAEGTTTTVPEQVDIDGSQKPTEPAFDDGKQEPVYQINEKSQQEPVDQSLLVKQGVANATDESKAASLGNDHRQKRVSHKQKPSVKMVEALTLGDKSTLTGTGEAMSSQEQTLANNSNVVTESTQQKKRTNKSSKNKHKLDDASASREVELLESNPSEIMVTDSKDTKQSNPEQVSSLPSNQHKPQHPRRTPRNPQANRFHVGDVAVWAPVRAHNKEEVTHDDVALPEKSVASTQTNPKSKRAEMERYVPKPVAKESALEDMNVGPTVESKSGDNKQNKQVKSHGALKKSYQKSTSQHEELNPVSTEANVTHEWDPSDGWFMPDEYPTTAVVKDEGKEKRPAYKGQRSNVKNHKDISGVDPEVDQVDRPPSKENRSNWHPKPQYKGDWSGGSQTSNLESRKEPVDGNQEGQRERKPSSFKTRAYSPNMEDEAQAQARQFDPQHHGFRKYGGQNDKPRHNANANKDRQRQNLHYEYQPVGSNNNSKERSSGSGQGQSRRGGGSYYGRQ